MRKLTKEEQDILNNAVADIQRKYTQGLLPEEEKLLEEQFTNESSPSLGYHVHDENNPTGMHRHSEDDALDGAHRHTLMNPGGEHAHGLLEGQALADGTHYHDYSGLGYHHHKEDDDANDGSKLVPEKKPEIL
jgi:hypothetical protein